MHAVRKKTKARPNLSTVNSTKAVSSIEMNQLFDLVQSLQTTVKSMENEMAALKTSVTKTQRGSSSSSTIGLDFTPKVTKSQFLEYIENTLRDEMMSYMQLTTPVLASFR
jgi:hypothetical protein